MFCCYPCQSIFNKLKKDEDHTSLVKQVDQECQTDSIPQENKRIQTNSFQKAHQKSQTDIIKTVNRGGQNCSEQLEKESYKKQIHIENRERRKPSRPERRKPTPSLSILLQSTTFIRCLECQYDLLDHLLNNGCLTFEVVNDLRQAYGSERERNNALIKMINPTNVRDFTRGLKASNQSHLANYLNKNGTNESNADENWPVSDSQIAPIIKSYPDLVRDLYNRSLIDELWKDQCLSFEQKNKILSKDTTEEKNRELLGIMMRRSVRQLKIFLNCLERDHGEILLQSQDKELYAVSYYNTVNLTDAIAKKGQEIVLRSEDPTLGINARFVDDRLYFVTKTEVDDSMIYDYIESDFHSENAIDIKKIVSDVQGENYREYVNIDYILTDENIYEDHYLPSASTYSDRECLPKTITPESSTDSQIGTVIVGKNKLHLSSTPLFKTIPHDMNIKGVTIVDDEIFVTTYEEPKVNVYDSDSLRAKRNINISGMKSPEGLAGCSYNSALYIGDYEFECIYRVDLTNDSVADWKIRENHKPHELSLTAEHTLLVTVQIEEDISESGLVEYTSEGQQVRMIRFDSNVDWAWKTVQLSSNQYIVSHENGVCIINNVSQIIRTLVKVKGGRLNAPCSVEIDDIFKRIFVADFNNNRVLLFDTDLAYVGQVCTPHDLSFPSYLCFDSRTADRLFVGEKYSGRLLVINLPH